MTSRPTALFVFSIYNFYREMLPVAEYYAKQGARVQAVIGWNGENADECADYCRAAGFEVVRVPESLSYYAPRSTEKSEKKPAAPATPLATSPESTKTKLLRLRRTLLKPLTGLISLTVYLRRHQQAYTYAKRLIDQCRPAVVFAGHYHSCGKLDNAIAQICQQRGIPYCGLSVSIYVGEQQLTIARFNNIKLGMVPASLRADRSLFARLVARLFPQWTRQQDGVRIFMWEPLEMLAARLRGSLDRNPWQKPSERFNAVFVEAEFSKKMLADSGYHDLNKVIVAGKPLLDVVLENAGNAQYEQELFEYLGLQPNEPYILCNVEPSAEHHYATWEEHWRNFESVMTALKQTGRRVILSLHPLCAPENYRFVEEQYGFKISERYKIGQLYPYADFVVSFACSTNAYSAIFNRKLIIYDFFGMTKDDYPAHHFYRWPNASYAYTGEQVAQRLSEYLSTNGTQSAARPMTSHQQLACELIYRTVQDRFGIT